MRKNAKLNRIALRGLLAALALGGLQVAHAGYAQLAAPAGFGGSSGAFTYAANAANDKTFGRVVHSAGSLTANVGGQAVKMGAAYRLAANAPRIAAAVVMQHPGIRLAVGAAGVVAWLASAKLVYDVATGTWRETADESTDTTKQYRYNGQPWTTLSGACQQALAYQNQVDAGTIYSSTLKSCQPGQAILTRKDPWGSSDVGRALESRSVTATGCPTGWTSTPAGCLSPELDQPTFVDKLAAQPMPSSVPLELPYPSPLPIEQPSPWINPTPGENPQSQPLRIPTGQPSPVPNTNPQQYRQPYVDIVPAPTPDNPFRVDVKPGETVSTDPNPVENPKPDGQDKPTEEQDKSLCEKHPDILACSKPELDIPDGEIPKVTKQITYAEEGGFGGGSCPSNVYANLHGKQTMVYEWTRTCSVVSTYIRPIILLLGAMGALFILIPGRDS